MYCVMLFSRKQHRNCKSIPRIFAQQVVDSQVKDIIGG